MKTGVGMAAAAALALLAVAATWAAEAETSKVLAPTSPFEAARFDSWTVIGPGGGGAMYNPTISPVDPKVVLVNCDMTGAYISLDGGDSWRMFNGRTVSRFFVCDPNDADIIYSMRLGLMRSADRGKTWSLVFPDSSNVERVLISGDHGEEEIITKDGTQEYIAALAVEPGDSKKLYAAMANGQEAWLAVSTDWGKTWSKAGTLAGGVRRIFVDPKSPADERTIYVLGGNSVSVRKGGNWTHGGGPEGVQRFNDMTLGWGKDGTPVVYGLSGFSFRRFRGAPAGGAQSPPVGVFVTRDLGVTWEKADADFFAKGKPGAARPPQLKAIAACLSNPDVVYLSYQGFEVEEGSAEGAAKTTDGGKTWSLVWKDINETPGENFTQAWLTQRFGSDWGEAPTQITVAQDNADLCYSTDLGRTVRTTDGGKTWVEVYSRKVPGAEWSTAGLDVTTCYGVHFDPFDQNRMFISYTDIGLMMSEDRGTSWQSVTRGAVPGRWVNTTYWMAFDPEVKGRGWAAMSGPHDLPRTKMWRTGGFRFGGAPAGDASQPSVPAQTGGVCITSDGGRTWTPSNVGMDETPITHVIMDPKSPAEARVLYATGFGTGVWKSSDGGKSWALKNSGIRVVKPFAWRLAMDRDGRLYLVIARRSDDGSIGNEDDGAIYASDDGAENWKKVALPAGCNAPNGLAIAPDDPQRLYLAAWGRKIEESDQGGGIFLSTNGGRTWKNVLSVDQHIYDVTIDPRDSDVLYACGFESSAYRSDDRGKTWTRIRGFNFKWGHRVIPDPLDPGKIFITTFGGSVWYGPAKGDPKAVEDIVTPEIAFSK